MTVVLVKEQDVSTALLITVLLGAMNVTVLGKLLRGMFQTLLTFHLRCFLVRRRRDGRSTLCVLKLPFNNFKITVDGCDNDSFLALTEKAQ